VLIAGRDPCRRPDRGHPHQSAPPATPRLDDSALEAVRAWRFEPARRMGAVVDAWVEIPIRFQALAGVIRSYEAAVAAKCQSCKGFWAPLGGREKKILYDRLARSCFPWGTF